MKREKKLKSSSPSVQDVSVSSSFLILGKQASAMKRPKCPKSSVLVWILNSPENRKKILATVSLHLLPFFCTSTQTTYDDITNLSK